MGISLVNPQIFHGRGVGSLLENLGFRPQASGPQPEGVSQREEGVLGRFGTDQDPAALLGGLYEVAHAALVRRSFQSGSLAAAMLPAASASTSPIATLTPPSTNSGSLMGRLERALHSLGLDAKGTNQIMLLAQLVSRLAPRAFQGLVEGFEELARAMQAISTPTSPDPSPAAASQLQLEFVSVRLTVTEVNASVTQSAEGTTAEVSMRSFDVQLERVQLSIRQNTPAQADPLVLDLKGDGVAARPTSDGVIFDITGSGEAVRTAFVKGDDALLFYDANGNGSLDNGTELVGNRVAGLDAGQELAALDKNHDGKINADDPAYARLRLFRDLNGDGRAQPSEAESLRALGVAELSALLTPDVGAEGNGVQRVARSTFQRADGSQGTMFDYLFGYEPA